MMQTPAHASKGRSTAAAAAAKDSESRSRRRASADSALRPTRSLGDHSSSQQFEDLTNQVSPAARSKMMEKREMRNLNSRLRWFMERTVEQNSKAEKLKRALAETEVMYRQKLKENDAQFQKEREQLGSEKEALVSKLDAYRSELDMAKQSRENLEIRNAHLEGEITRKTTALELKEKEIEPLRQQLQQMGEEIVSLKSTTRVDMKQFNRIKNEKRQLSEDLKRVQDELHSSRARHKVENDQNQRIIAGRNDECESLKMKCARMEAEKSELETKVRKEFDDKMATFMEKREQQYEQEKKEWIRIFKEEFQAKTRRYKEENAELKGIQKKLSQEIEMQKQRYGALKKIKSELENTNRNLEEQLEKAHSDLDEFRDNKELEMKDKESEMSQLQRLYNEVREELEEVTNGKLQLDSEIGLYRQLLSQAEKECGFEDSPFLKSMQKRRKMNNMDTGIQTPGFVRARKRAREDLDNMSVDFGASSSDRDRVAGEPDADGSHQSWNNNGEDTAAAVGGSGAGALGAGGTTSSEAGSTDSEGKPPAFSAGFSFMFGSNRGGRGASKTRRSDSSQSSAAVAPASDQCLDTIEPPTRTRARTTRKRKLQDIHADEDCKRDVFDLTTDGMSGESFPLQFSSMDLFEGVLELQNVSDEKISLKGYYLTNKDKTRVLKMPGIRTLEPNERVRVVIGSNQQCDVDDIPWSEDVWSGTRDDIARLFNKHHLEVARIEITTDMLDDNSRSTRGCFVM